MRKAVLVIDMTRGFCEEGYPLYCGEAIRNIIPNVQKLLKKAQEEGTKIIYICDHHDPGDLEFETFPPHCIEGTAETEIIPELKDNFPGEVVPKKRYSVFYNTNLDEILEREGIEKILISGVCTDICVMHSTADARNRDYPVEVYEDCVASFNEEAHHFALKHMKESLGAELVRIGE